MRSSMLTLVLLIVLQAAAPVKPPACGTGQVGVYSNLYTADAINAVPIDGGLTGTGLSTRYWDCCKPSCAWKNDDIKVKAPVASCAADGVTILNDLAVTSGCHADGTAYMCSDEQPIVVNDTFAMGFAAGSFLGSGGVDDSMCCTCFLLSFKGQLEGKRILVQITNTGSDLNNYQFDLSIPGGGVGIFNGCTSQWGAPEDGWGQRYGGVSTVEECSELPEQLQAGCRFRFEWMEGVKNSNLTFVQVGCPVELTRITGCAVL